MKRMRSITSIHKKPMILLFITALILVALLLVRSILNGYHPARFDQIEVTGPTCPDMDKDTPLTIMSWNIGFSGMSAEMDFYADGGSRKRASSSAQVEQNYSSIREKLRDSGAPVIFIQELAKDSFITRNVDILSRIRDDFSDYQFTFTPTVKIRPLPIIGNLEVGKSTLSTFRMIDAERKALPTAPDLPTITMQHYNILISRLPVVDADWEWVLLNIHMAAFDDGELRSRQLQEIVSLMKEEYMKGNRVIAGGDWNLLLAQTKFPYSTDEKNLFWIREMPSDVVPDDWQWGVDRSAPTCRTLEQPFRKGVNYTCVIDGFLVTPNVEIIDMKTTDLDFKNSDHNPIQINVRSRP